MSMDVLCTLIYRAADTLPLSVRSTIRRAALFLGQERVRSFYSQFVSACDLVFDIGASVGDLSKVFLDLGARLVCVEPHPGSARCLRDRLDHTDQVVVIETGLNDAEGTLPLQVSSRNPGTSTFAPEFTTIRRHRHRSWDRTMDVAVTTLDKLIETYGIPAFSKIDVEGSELRVLRGLSSALPLLSFEFTPDLSASAASCLSHLGTLGTYEYNFALHYAFSFSAKAWLAADQFLEAVRSGPGSWWYGDIYARLLP